MSGRARVRRVLRPSTCRSPGTQPHSRSIRSGAADGRSPLSLAPGPDDRRRRGRTRRDVGRGSFPRPDHLGTPGHPDRRRGAPRLHRDGDRRAGRGHGLRTSGRARGGSAGGCAADGWDVARSPHRRVPDRPWRVLPAPRDLPAHRLRLDLAAGPRRPWRRLHRRRHGSRPASRRYFPGRATTRPATGPAASGTPRRPAATRRATVNRPNRGALVGGTWLIGLGVVFLVRQAMDVSWNEAWPLFVILVGVATLVTSLVDRRPGRWTFWALTWPIVWIGVGFVLLLSTTGRLAMGPGELITDYWPWLLVGLGGWFLIGAFIPRGKPPDEDLAIPLGGVRQASVRVRFGAGTLDSAVAGAGHLIDGRFVGGVLHRGDARSGVDLEQDTSYGMPFLQRESAWTLGLTGEVPLE